MNSNETDRVSRTTGCSPSFIEIISSRLLNERKAQSLRVWLHTQIRILHLRILNCQRSKLCHSRKARSCCIKD